MRRKRRLILDVFLFAAVLTLSTRVCVAVTPFAWWLPPPLHLIPMWFPDVWEPDTKPYVKPWRPPGPRAGSAMCGPTLDPPPPDSPFLRPHGGEITRPADD
jgi:hypothetical protein